VNDERAPCSLSTMSTPPGCRLQLRQCEKACRARQALSQMLISQHYPERAMGLEPATSGLGRRPVHGRTTPNGTALERVTASTPSQENGESGLED
jgi:hypothetical protein